jgi:hypothetical protein
MSSHSFGLHGLEFPGLGAVGVVAVVGDEALEVLELRLVADLVVSADEVALIPAAGGFHDRLDGLAGHVSAQNQHVGLVDLGRVDELTEAQARSVQVGDEVDERLGHG